MRNKQFPFDYTFQKGADIKPEDRGNGYSDDVLIDIDGWRKTFRIGYYDHDNDMWILYDKSEIKNIELPHLMWSELPLNKEEIELD